MGERWLFASDIHLAPSAPERTATFLDFLQREASGAARLYILGDLFDLYVGPRHARALDYREAIAALTALRASGVRVEHLHGNRDFQVGAELPFDCVHPEAIVLEGEGQRILIAHGDTYCTRDRSYLRARRVLRSRPIKAIAACAPVGLVRGVGRWLRGRSRQAIAAKTAYATDLDVGAIVGAFSASDADAMVVGHVHRMRELEAQIGDRPRRFIGLGSWDDSSGSFAEFHAGSIRLFSYACSRGRLPLSAREG